MEENQMSKSTAVLVLIAVALICVIGTTILMTGGGPIITGFQISRYGETNVTVTNVTDITVTVSSVDFGSMQTNTTNDSTNDDPAPFQVENNGSETVDVTVLMNATLFTGLDTGNDSSSFRYKADNETVGAFDWDNSITTWTNFTLEAIEVIDSLDFNDSQDDAEVEIQVHVPADEGSGLKSSQITFTGSAAS